MSKIQTTNIISVTPSTKITFPVLSSLKKENDIASTTTVNTLSTDNNTQHQTINSNINNLSSNIDNLTTTLELSTSTLHTLITNEIGRIINDYQSKINNLTTEIANVRRVAAKWPDYNKNTCTYIANGTSFTAPEDGWITITGTPYNETLNWIDINGIPLQIYGDNWLVGICPNNISLPIAKGDVIWTGSFAGNHAAIFWRCKNN